MYFKNTVQKCKALLLAGCFASLAGRAQTDMDAIMMNKHQACAGFDYMHSSWDHYWEGRLKRTNENIGTVTTQSVMFMPVYGITDNLNVMASAMYVWTNASDGTLHGLKGMQDISAFVKWKALKKNFGKNKISLFLLGGLSTPSNNYTVDLLPMSIGLGAKSAIGRGMVDFLHNRINVTASAAYVRRSNVKLDRTSYYDTELHLTDEIRMPNAMQYQLRAGYRGKYLLAEALLNNWTTCGGFDITRNNMPFPSNRMNATSVGVALKYTLKSNTHLSFVGGASTTIDGEDTFLASRNVGQATAFNAGVFYAFYLKK